MKAVTVALVVAAAVIGLGAGFLWWGRPTGRLEAQLGELRGNAERLSRDNDELRAREHELAAQLQAQQKRLETAERDLRAEKQMNSQLHLLVGQGRK
jgi:uncharacterized protein HemX